MSSIELKTALTPFLKLTRRMVIQPGEIGQLPVTKIGGVPWWPAGVSRPICSSGHTMSFFAQIRLSDVPELGPDDPGLLSFHYCHECSYEGNMPQGWSEPGCTYADPMDSTRYDLSIFTDFADRPADGLGVIAEDIEGPLAVSFVSIIEAPDWDEAGKIPQLSRFRNFGMYDVEALEDDFDETPEFVHIATSKLGGWPSWVHDPEWPRDYPDEELLLVAQLAPIGDCLETWCCGMAYLFLQRAPIGDRKAKLLLQYT